MHLSPRLLAVAVGLFSLAALLAFAQVSVTASDVESSRACGSSFDVIADRSGWEVWWAADLDDPDPAVGDALLRTRNCPSAVNVRTVAAGVVATLAALTLVAAAASTSRHSGDLGRLGTTTVATGAALTALGITAIVVLVADSESTLFIYVDRLVVAVIGLIVLVPPISLVVFGRALRIVDEQASSDEPSERDA